MGLAGACLPHDHDCSGHVGADPHVVVFLSQMDRRRIKMGLNVLKRLPCLTQRVTVSLHLIPLALTVQWLQQFRGQAARRNDIPPPLRERKGLHANRCDGVAVCA